MTANQNKLIANWSKVGGGFWASPSHKSPDLERLLLGTARCASGNSRLFTVASTWLSRYGALIAQHRLKRLVITELEAQYQPVLGLLLEIAIEFGAPKGLGRVVEVCAVARSPRPLFDVYNETEKLKAIAGKNACSLSRKWNLWVEHIEPKYDAIRPREWVSQANPSYRQRIRYKGGLRATIVETLKRDTQNGRSASESELGRLCCAYRKGLRESLDKLELEGVVRRVRNGKNRSVQLVGAT